MSESNNLPPEIMAAILDLKGSLTALSGKVDGLNLKLDHQIERTSERNAALKESLEQRLESVHTLIESGDRQIGTSVSMLAASSERLEKAQMEQSKRLRDVEDHLIDTNTVAQAAKLTVERHDARISKIETANLESADVLTSAKAYETRIRKLEDALTSARGALFAVGAFGGLGGGGIAALIIKIIG